ncbi:MAG: hypothetical protein GY747_00595 [Planctomycetes bacterium]|nr:hypothetical protein [Planctomycetota bacterium]MCP4770808.1 hypothetical protein [Planctomycetota bacterium]MCP4861348.1 hypothetical protein [Planctomycetota bacterium]
MILLLLAWLGLDIAAQQDPFPADHMERVTQLLGEPAVDSPRWRKTLYQSLTRLERAPVEQTLPAWQILAENSGDIGLANLILFCRRHQLPLPEQTLTEGASSQLERSLALWGSGQLDSCLNAMQAGAAAYPADSRFRTNLDWLKMHAPQELAADCTSRELAQAVLAARAARP